jgi:hypothetical protein
MRKSWLRRIRRRSGWKPTAAAVAADRLVVPETTVEATRLAPTDSASDGLAIETYVLARLLGIRLLTLEGVVLVSPARVTSPSPAERGLDQAPTTPASPVLPMAGIDRPPGSSLAQASQLLRECDEELRVLESRG